MPQGVSPGPNPPQFDSLAADTQLVTVGIGGNDIGFSDIVESCCRSTPSGHPCQDHYVVNGHDELADRIEAAAPKVAAVLDGIHARSPRAQDLRRPLLADPARERARLLAAAPHRLLTTSPTCGGWRRSSTPCSPSRPPRTGPGFVDAYAAGIGHDACQLPVVRWVEPAVPDVAGGAGAPQPVRHAGVHGGGTRADQRARLNASHLRRGGH